MLIPPFKRYYILINYFSSLLLAVLCSLSAYILCNCLFLLHQNLKCFKFRSNIYMFCSSNICAIDLLLLLFQIIFVGIRSIFMPKASQVLQPWTSHHWKYFFGSLSLTETVVIFCRTKNRSFSKALQDRDDEKFFFFQFQKIIAPCDMILSSFHMFSEYP